MTTILSVSLPAELRPMVDAEAKRQRRSRSFIVGEAIREYLGRKDRDTFTAARDQTLREGLALAPADRLKVAEQLWHELTGDRALPQPWTATFETFDEYDTWRKQARGQAT